MRGTKQNRKEGSVEAGKWIRRLLVITEKNLLASTAEREMERSGHMFQI